MRAAGTAIGFLSSDGAISGYRYLLRQRDTAFYSAGYGNFCRSFCCWVISSLIRPPSRSRREKEKKANEEENEEKKETYQSERRRWKVHKGLKKGIAVLAAAVLFCGSAPVDIYAAEYGDDFHEKGLSPLCEKIVPWTAGRQGKPLY